MTPDLIVINADIRTMDPLKPQVQALASHTQVMLTLLGGSEVYRHEKFGG